MQDKSSALILNLSAKPVVSAEQSGNIPKDIQDFQAQCRDIFKQLRQCILSGNPEQAVAFFETHLKIVKKDYYRLALKYHPDKKPEEEKPWYEEQFKLLSDTHTKFIDKCGRLLQGEMIYDHDELISKTEEIIELQKKLNALLNQLLEMLRQHVEKTRKEIDVLREEARVEREEARVEREEARVERERIRNQREQLLILREEMKIRKENESEGVLTTFFSQVKSVFTRENFYSFFESVASFVKDLFAWNKATDKQVVGDPDKVDENTANNSSSCPQANANSSFTDVFHEPETTNNRMSQPVAQYNVSIKNNN